MHPLLMHPMHGMEFQGKQGFIPRAYAWEDRATLASIVLHGAKGWAAQPPERTVKIDLLGFWLYQLQDLCVTAACHHDFGGVQHTCIRRGTAC